MGIAENMLAGLIKQLGISPNDIKKVVQLVERLDAMVSEIDQFKAAAAAWTQHFNARFDAIEARLKRAEETARLPVISTGEATHERNHVNGIG